MQALNARDDGGLALQIMVTLKDWGMNEFRYPTVIVDVTNSMMGFRLRLREAMTGVYRGLSLMGHSGWVQIIFLGGIPVHHRISMAEMEFIISRRIPSPFGNARASLKETYEKLTIGPERDDDQYFTTTGTGIWPSKGPIFLIDDDTNPDPAPEYTMHINVAQWGRSRR